MSFFRDEIEEHQRHITKLEDRLRYKMYIVDDHNEVIGVYDFDDDDNIYRR